MSGECVVSQQDKIFTPWVKNPIQVREFLTKPCAADSPGMPSPPESKSGENGSRFSNEPIHE